MSGRVGALRLVLVGMLLSAPSGRAQAQDDPWFAPDKGLHFGVSLALSAGAYGASVPWLERPASRALFGVSFAMTLGLAKEGWDATGRGDASLRDLTWDLVGSLSGAAIAWGVDRLVVRLRARDQAGVARGSGLRRARGLSGGQRQLALSRARPARALATSSAPLGARFTVWGGNVDALGFGPRLCRE